MMMCQNFGQKFEKDAINRCQKSFWQRQNQLRAAKWSKAFNFLYVQLLRRYMGKVRKIWSETPPRLKRLLKSGFDTTFDTSGQKSKNF